jgi:hypothetical protein
MSGRRSWVTETPMDLGVAYFDSRAPRHYRADLDDIVEAGCTYIVHTFSEYDVLYQVERVRDLVRETKRLGLAVWLDPWGVGEVFGGEPFSRFGALHPDDRQVLSDGTALPAACMTSSSFERFVEDWIGQAARVGADAIFWDEPHWFWDPDSRDWACYCSRCQALFRSRFGFAMPKEYTSEVQSFREEMLARFLGKLFVSAHDHGLANVLCVMPPDRPNPGFRDWTVASSIPGLDNIGTDPYPEDPGNAAPYVYLWTERLLRAAMGRGLGHHVWIRGFEIPAGAEEIVPLSIKAATAAGATNLAVWSYMGCEAMATCTCGDPQKVWRLVKEAFVHLRGA